MAVAAKAKGPASDSIMTPDKMKPLLALSKHEPLHAAIALTNEGDGLILLDKKAKPKKVMSMLRADAAKAKITLNNATVRFGRAEVDTEYDPGMVRFFINKDAPGNMRVKLVEVVKRIAYQKVEINVDPSFEAEPEEDEAETETGDAQAGAGSTAAPPAETVPVAPVAPPQSQAAEPPDAAALAHELGLLMRRIPEATATDAALKAQAVKLATDGNTAVKANNLEVAQGLITQLREALDGAVSGSTGAAPPVPPPTPRPPAAPPANAAALGHQLALLIKRIGEVSSADPSQRGNLAKMAGDANTALKENDLAAAGTAIAQLRDALDLAASGAQDAETPDDTAAAAWQAARKAWQNANDAVNDQINGLRAALLEEAKQGDGDTEGLALALTDLAENGLNEITEDHRVRVMAAIQELGSGTPAATRKFGAQALALIEGFESFLDSNPKIAACDDNPYDVPVSIRATLTPPLRQMAAALQAATAS